MQKDIVINYSNGNCTFEARTGKKCNFEHIKAPNCNFDGSCRREKCMFSHPTQANKKQSNFLEGRKSPMRQPVQIKDFVEQLMEQLQQTNSRGRN